jgi:hypothetical protein
MIEDTPGFKAVQEFYGDRTAKRSGVPLINHIREGIAILKLIGADLFVQEAYAVHPLFQADADLTANFQTARELDPYVLLYALEYRHVANSFLSNAVEQGPNAWGRVEVQVNRPLKLSALRAVNEMLIADKVQNRKDFELYHKASHARTLELDYYFKFWLKALGVSETKYQELIKDL